MSTSFSQPQRFVVMIIFFLIACLYVTIFRSVEDSGSYLGFAPVICAFAIILLSNQAWMGLLAGSLVGVLALNEGITFSVIKGFWQTFFFPVFDSAWHIGAILFTLILGSFARVMERSGAFESLLKIMLHRGKGNAQRNIESSTVGLGLICFFDGLANSLLVGRLMTPLADRTAVSRAKLAYIVDSTSSSVACIAFISTWIATQLSLIDQSIADRGIESSAYTLFFKSIPYNFYCLFTLTLVILVVWRSWDIGPMKKSFVHDPVKEEEKAQACPINRTAPIAALFWPLAILSISLFTLFYLWGAEPLLPITVEKITSSFGGSAGPYVMVFSSLLGLLAAVLFFPKERKHEVPKAIKEGAAEMLGPLIILILAWCFGSILKELGTARFLSESITGSVPPSLFPAAVFLIGAVISFTTGSSWGTMGLLMPIALPAFLDLQGYDPNLIPAVIAAVFSGAVFGDHCSPFSDTTIVSAFSCGIDAKEHVVTQLPYASIAAGVSLTVGFGGLYFFRNPLIGLLAGALILLGITSYKRPKKERPY